jgi:hypothetical protein
VDDAVVRREGYRADPVYRDHGALEAGCQHAHGRVEAVKSQRDTPGSAAGYVVDRHDDWEEVTVIAGGVKENCVL